MVQCGENNEEKEKSKKLDELLKRHEKAQKDFEKAFEKARSNSGNSAKIEKIKKDNPKLFEAIADLSKSKENVVNLFDKTIEEWKKKCEKFNIKPFFKKYNEYLKKINENANKLNALMKNLSKEEIATLTNHFRNNKKTITNKHIKDKMDELLGVLFKSEKKCEKKAAKFIATFQK
jgi:vacuolar-type H+-ATPase subunit I/STV1